MFVSTQHTGTRSSLYTKHCGTISPVLLQDSMGKYIYDLLQEIINIFVTLILNMENTHAKNIRIEERTKIGPHLTKHEHTGINGRIAVVITNLVSTMWCAYVFAGIALISLPAAIHGGTAALISWIAQTFLQLVLLSVIMVGQKVAAAASDKQALQTYKDAEALLKLQDEVHRLIEINNTMTQEIHSFILKKPTEEIK